MNQSSVISKFIEKCGPLDPKPHLHFVQGGVKGHFGLTTEPSEALQVFRSGFYRKYHKYPNIKISSPSDILPRQHLEYENWSYDFDNKDLITAMRCLQNAPFNKIQVIHSTEPFPMIFSRQDCKINIILAPITLEIPKEEVKKEQVEHFKGNPWRDGKPQYYWTQQLPNSTFWIVEYPTIKGIAQLIKCRNCNFEIDRESWVKKVVTMNHPECQCSCDTYDDFCECRKRREQATFDRIRRESTIKKHFMRNHWDMA